MEATAISHIAICTRDMEKSLAFYRDILGMQVLADAMTDPTEGGRLHNYLSFAQINDNELRPKQGEEPRG